jgi:sensor histidine kinase YesM
VKAVHAHPDHLLARNLRSVGTYVALWFVPTLIGTTASLVIKGPDGTFNWLEYLSLYFGYWLIWVVATPLIYRLLIVSPIDRPRRSAILLMFENVALLIIIIAVAQLYFLFVDFVNAVAPFSRAQYVERAFSAGSFWFNGTHLIKYAFVALACVLLRQYRLRLSEERNRAEADIRNRELESQLATARLSLLQSQVQPHVFLNALNGIAALIDAGMHETAKDAIQDIAEFLRLTLTALERKRVLLSDDLELSRAYIRLLKLRFGDRVDAKVNVPADTQTISVPSLLTQPLIENIARHVIERCSDTVTFSISAIRSEKHLDVFVDDSGVRKESTQLPAIKGCGIGISNLRKRLEAIYGSAASLSIGDSALGGRRVSLQLPLADAGGATLDHSD